MSFGVRSIGTPASPVWVLNVVIHLCVKIYSVTFGKIYSSELCLAIICQAYLHFLKVSLWGNYTEDSSKSFPWEKHSLGRSLCFSSPASIGMRNLLCLEVLYPRWMPTITNTFLKTRGGIILNTLMPPNQVSNLAKGIWLFNMKVSFSMGCELMRKLQAKRRCSYNDTCVSFPSATRLSPFSLKDLIASQVCKSQSWADL